MSNYRLSLLVLLFTALTQPGWAQSFAIQQYTVRDGLPSSYLYDITQDEKGFLWISTEGGLCRYDGLQFKKTPIKEIGSSEIINTFLDSRSRLWMVDLASRISYMDNDTVRSLDSLSSLKEKKFSKIWEDPQGNLWFFGPTESELLMFPGDRITDRYAQTYRSNTLEGHKTFIPLDSAQVMVVTSMGIHFFKNGKFKAFTEKRMGRGPFHYSYLDSSIIVSSYDYLYKINPETLKLDTLFRGSGKLFASGINHLFRDDRNNLWISTGEGLLLLAGGKGSQFQKFLDGVFVNATMQDHEGNYWIISQRDGLFRLPSLEIKIYRSDYLVNHISSVMTTRRGEIVMGFNNSFINIIDSDFKKIYEERLTGTNKVVQDIEVDNEGNIYFFLDDQLIVYDSTFSIIKRRKEGYNVGQIDEAGNIWFGSNSGAGRIPKANWDQRDYFLQVRTNSIYLIDSSRAWIGTVEGLYYLEDGNATKVNLPQLDQDIRDIQMSKDSTLWLATQGNGVILYKNDSIIYHLTAQNGLLSNNCNKLLLDEPYGWLATNEGINKIHLYGYNVKTIIDDDGLPSDEVNDLHKVGRTILAATNGGLAAFADTLSIYTQPPLLYFSGIEISDRDTALQSSYVLDYNENNVQIRFTGVAYKYLEYLEFKYKMEGLPRDWTYTTVPLAQFPSLPPKDYVFRLSAKTKNSPYSEEISIRFTVKKPFWDTWWFTVLVIAVAVLAGYRFFLWIISDYKRRNEIKEKLKESQLTALRAQMNPHFLFNALNSIQEFIINQDKRSANRYLSKFSRLMRNILNMSDKDEVSLKTEIESLDLYLSLEALRFEENFSYKIIVDPKIDKEKITIPPMLVQPYVENAVKHGLLHKKNGIKELSIHFHQQDNHLVCEVTDNGIGRKRSKVIRQENARIYPSKAMSLTQERLDLLSSAMKGQLNIQVIDLEDENGEATGTKVILYVNTKIPEVPKNGKTIRKKLAERIKL